MERLVIDVNFSQRYLKEDINKIYGEKERKEVISGLKDPPVIVDFVGAAYNIEIENEQVSAVATEEFEDFWFRGFCFTAIITVESFSSFFHYLEDQDCYDMESGELDPNNFGINFLSGWDGIGVEDPCSDIILPSRDHIDGEVRRLE